MITNTNEIRKKLAAGDPWQITDPSRGGRCFTFSLQESDGTGLRMFYLVINGIPQRNQICFLTDCGIHKVDISKFLQADTQDIYFTEIKFTNQ